MLEVFIEFYRGGTVREPSISSGNKVYVCNGIRDGFYNKLDNKFSNFNQLPLT